MRAAINKKIKIFAAKREQSEKLLIYWSTTC